MSCPESFTGGFFDKIIVAPCYSAHFCYGERGTWVQLLKGEHHDMADIVSGVVGVGICFVVNIFYPVFAAELTYFFPAYLNQRTGEFSLANRK